MRRLLVGTAGHVDHGKTRLVQALTGVDCDRWAEEKERGITIDLGFAHFSARDTRVSFIDVPGHERFLHNALAGLGGLDAAILVVAADDGPKPQTHEHLAILGQLRVERLLVALTKIDLAAPARADVVQVQVAELLARTRWPAAPILRVSSVTGAGVEALRAELIAAARSEARERARARPFRLPIDRAFHLEGRGLVVTGTLIAGRVAPGSSVETLPAGVAARVRTVHVHGAPVAEATAGERVALQVHGLEPEQVERGTTLSSPGALRPTRSLCVRFELLAGATLPTAAWTPVRLHLFSGQAIGRIRTLGTQVAELRLASDVVACRGDRFIVRTPSPALTLGGGEVLDPFWRRPRRAALGPIVEGLSGDDDDATVTWVETAGPSGLEPSEVGPRLGEALEAARQRLVRLAASGRLLALGPARFVAPAVVRERLAAAERLLAVRTGADRFGAGLSRSEFVERLLGAHGLDVGEAYLLWLEAAGKIRREGGRILAPGAATMGSEDSRLAEQIVQAFESARLEPPSPGEIARSLSAKPAIVDGVIGALVRRRELVRLPGGLIIGAGTVARLRADLLATGWQRFAVPAFKQRFALSRKWAIPLLEHLDSLAVTRRVGDERILLTLPGDPKE